MDETFFCPKCQQLVKNTDNFCYNCGKNFHPLPPPTSAADQLFLYLKTILLPPLGLFWGLRYLRQSDNKSKVIGLIVIVVTVVETIWLVQATISSVNTINEQINQIDLSGF
jgi:hypothetical protein